jgi:hypothetical protein
MKLTLKDGTVINNIKSIDFKPGFVMFSHPIRQSTDRKARITGSISTDKIKTIERQDKK